MKNGNVKLDEDIIKKKEDIPETDKASMETKTGEVMRITNGDNHDTKDTNTKGKALMTIEEKGRGDIGYGAYLYYFGNTSITMKTLRFIIGIYIYTVYIYI